MSFRRGRLETQQDRKEFMQSLFLSMTSAEIVLNITKPRVLGKYCVTHTELNYRKPAQ